MVAIVKRVSILTGKSLISLRHDWSAEAKQSLSSNFGRFDSRSFIMTAKRFLEKNKVKITAQDATQV